jgi:hypothetical protein
VSAWPFQGSKPSKAAASAAAAAAKDEPPAATAAKSEVEEDKVNDAVTPRTVDNIVVSMDDGYSRPSVSAQIENSLRLLRSNACRL